MKYPRKTIKGKKYVPIAISHADNGKLAAHLEKITKEYINLMYEVQLVTIEGLIFMPNDKTNRIEWMQKKVNDINQKILNKLKEEAQQLRLQHKRGTRP